MGGEIKGKKDRESVRSKSTENFERKSTTDGEKRVLSPADKMKNDLLGE